MFKAALWHQAATLIGIVRLSTAFHDSTHLGSQNFITAGSRYVSFHYPTTSPFKKSKCVSRYIILYIFGGNGSEYTQFFFIVESIAGGVVHCLNGL